MVRTSICIDCGETFPVEKTKGRLPARCKPCFRLFGNERMRRWREANPERAREIYQRNNAKRLADPEHRRKKREDAVRRTYGLEPEELNRLLDVQGHRCAICNGLRNGAGARLHVDHCHTTGRVRGLLCAKCNTMLGLASEDPQILARAIEYLCSR